jgi:hypothetical protein
MKNTCMIPLVFIATSFFLAVPIAFFIALANPSSFSLLLNNEFSHFMTFWLFNFFSYLPFCLVLGFIGVFFYLMRHKSVMLFSILIVVGLMFVSVLTFIPIFYKTMNSFHGSMQYSLAVQKKYTEQIFSNEMIRAFSSTKRFLWFFSDSSDTSVTPLIVADDSTIASNALMVIEKAFINTNDSSVVHDDKVIASGIPIYDPIIFDSHQVPPLLLTFTEFINATLTGFYTAAQSGFLPYLWTVIPFFLSVLSLWPWCNWTQWRLLNILLCSAGLIFIFTLYPMATSPEFQDIVPLLPYNFLLKRFSYLLPQFLFISVNCIVMILVGVSRKMRSASKVGV